MPNPQAERRSSARREIEPQQSPDLGRSIDIEELVRSHQHPAEALPRLGPGPFLLELCEVGSRLERLAGRRLTPEGDPVRAPDAHGVRPFVLEFPRFDKTLHMVMVDGVEYATQNVRGSPSLSSAGVAVSVAAAAILLAPRKR